MRSQLDTGAEVGPCRAVLSVRRMAPGRLSSLHPRVGAPRTTRRRFGGPESGWQLQADGVSLSWRKTVASLRLSRGREQHQECPGNDFDRSRRFPLLVEIKILYTHLLKVRPGWQGGPWPILTTLGRRPPDGK